MSSLRRRRSRSPADVEHDIRRELADILPMLRMEHCAMEVESFDPDTGTAVVTVQGGCPDCDVSPATFLQGIEAQLKLRIAELKSVKASVASTQ
jgi:Fe-S cluster biogenesis protein NfuA